MAGIKHSAEIADILSEIRSRVLLDHLVSAFHRLEAFPLSGSPNVPESLRARYGKDIRKVVVIPYDIIHEYDEASDTVYVVTIVPCAYVM